MNKTCHLLLFGSLTLPGLLSAQTAVDIPSRERVVELDPIQIIGSPDRIEALPGSAAYIDVGEIRSQGYDNIDQVIRRVPGVYFRTEDGFGLFPNISFRGIGSMRTSSLTVMEDGILSAPAPYANPAAYYTPTTGRMHGLEILKGSSQIQYGPHTTAGVINYLSTPVPRERTTYTRASYGGNHDIRFHGYTGESVETRHGTFGYLVEFYHRSNDGFKKIDGIGATPRSHDTGFTNNEPMVKLFWEPDTAVPQRIEFKLGRTDRDADETYLGLTEDDFQRDPFRRYASTMFDRIETEQTRTYLRHLIEPTPDNRLVTTGYYNEFNRAWYKLHDVNAQDGEGNINLSEALAGVNDGRPLGVLRGDRNGTIRVRNNNRGYASYGLESVFDQRFEALGADHTLQIGVRLHEDYEDRFQNQDTYDVFANDRIALANAGAPGSQDNRKGTARSIALHVKDTIEWDQWSVSPGIRYEHIRYRNNNRRTGVTNSASLDVYAPGIGATYRHTDHLSFFGGVFRGISTPSPTAVINGLKEESSLGFETGVRYNNRNGFQTEAVLFLTEFSDLIVPDNIGGTGTGAAENAGDARSMGLELSAGFDPGVANDWGFRMPNRVAFTYTDARIRGDAAAGTGSGAAVESIFAGARDGNRLPYVPEYQLSAGTGLEIDRWGAYLDAFFVGSTYADASNTRQQQRPDGTPDARFGKNDSYILFDVSVHYRLTESAKLIAGVQNLLNEEYIASRLPHGPRPGHPRFAHVGLEMTF